MATSPPLPAGVPALPTGAVASPTDVPASWLALSPLSSREEPRRLREVVRLADELLVLGELEPRPVELVVEAAVGVTCETVGSLGAAPVELLDVLVGWGVDRFRVVVRRCVAGSVTAGARRCPPEIGSEERPMCWLVSWLVAHVMPAVSTSPSSAASAQRAVCRLIRAP